MPKEIILPEGTPPPLAPYVPATKADNIVYVSGILPLDENNDVVHVGDAAAQTRHVLETIKHILSNAGGSLKDVTFNHIFLRDWADYPAINQVYAEYFPEERPARYCVQVGLVKPDALIEIASVAHV
ncbi:MULTISPECIES: pyrimidine utilization protein C [Acinetobacter]|uniref:3-aminoacrylate deaminase RutC n=1 Tax=Acinetobacter baylyi (strain ATCC 33305 / BD413 / ADP1) TaxID=62977 RepID=RUTC_ACIAD|nr:MULTISPECIES: pyrimidine utilization protein C [Acinetobacter]Q6FFZ5.1 RecName: Full=3-aminoacrylate deaminase RutC; Short=3-AA deaminase [Acinetobacter baylyi ADP1]ENV53111.1 pyrimidine utilization protein C [Acinetobacter baylyi DSM 14961 = CIP 107474]KAF2372073.1 pyrimidine utilization protein C [Acinetobacter baylyi]KAF2372252.1 pyrimidine utilization protein C [Acinetobacter baylyi]KAF2376272.1 pyrimidine utilization protein C [Acinetobacter baylyi]KAF2380599.1 pyrimidine utilization 